MGKLRQLWEGKNDGRNREERSFLRYFIFSTLVFIILVGFVNKNNVVRWVRSSVRIHNQNRQIERLQQEIKSMDHEIDGILSNRDSLEQFARENFHLAAPGDDVYIEE
ncbi:MAG: septum formation initiator family protein [Bacteroidales bacterium]|nr:septum formation initiator family protein [Bacteroidales bacterium]